MHCAHTLCSSAVTAVSRRPGGQNNKKKKERKIKYNNIILYLLDRLPDAYNCVMVTTCRVRSLGRVQRPIDQTTNTSPRDFGTRAESDRGNSTERDGESEKSNENRRSTDEKRRVFETSLACDCQLFL